MKKILYLSTCDTCKRIMHKTGTEGFELQDIKDRLVDEKALDKLKEQHGSYGALINRRAVKWRALGPKANSLSETEIKSLLLKEYTFLKRPVYIINDHSFLGNSPKTVEAIIANLHD